MVLDHFWLDVIWLAEARLLFLGFDLLGGGICRNRGATDESPKRRKQCDTRPFEASAHNRNLFANR
jgi:hypothetical protein